MIRTALLLAASSAAIPVSLEAQASGPPRAVLVTGASTGIGRKITEALAAKGYFVYAGARKEQDIKDLSAIPNVQGIRLDVAAPAEIAAAVETVTKAGRGLYGLVNNAGVAVIAPLIEVDEEDLKYQLEVNVMGPYRVTKAFSPLIIAAKGRVLITGSLSGFLSGTISGPYSMSKHAIEAYTDALAAEMARFDVKVSVLEPGNYKSDIGKSIVARMKARGQTLEGSKYQKEIKGFLDGDAASKDPEPDDVADAALRALGDARPQLRYMVVPAQWQAAITVQSLFRRIAQINQGHRFTYPRDSLVAMLDRSLARADSATGRR